MHTLDVGGFTREGPLVSLADKGVHPSTSIIEELARVPVLCDELALGRHPAC